MPGAAAAGGDAGAIEDTTMLIQFWMAIVGLAQGPLLAVGCVVACEGRTVLADQVIIVTLRPFRFQRQLSRSLPPGPKHRRTLGEGILDKCLLVSTRWPQDKTVRIIDHDGGHELAKGPSPDQP